MHRVAIVLALTTLLMVVSGGSIAAQPASGRTIRPGLVLREVPSASSAETAFVLQDFEVDLSVLRLKVLDARDSGHPVLTAREFCESSGALAAVNGGFFLEDRSPLGLIVSDGIQKNPLRKADWGVFFVAGATPRIVHTKELRLDDSVEQAIQVGPRLVVDGRPLKLKRQSARRSVVGIDGRGRVHVIVSSSGQPFASDLALLLSRPLAEGGLALTHALNLDGGPSTQLYAKAGGLEVDIPGGWSVPNALAVFARP